MMFVTADDSASVEKKKGAPGLVSNGAEECLKEVVMVVKAEIQKGSKAGRALAGTGEAVAILWSSLAQIRVNSA